MSASRPPLFEDTSPDAERVLIGLYQRMSPGRKAKQVEELTRGVQQLALARLRAEDPAADDETLKLRLAALWIDRDLLLAAYGEERLARAGLLNEALEATRTP